MHLRESCHRRSCGCSRHLRLQLVDGVRRRRQRLAGPAVESEALALTADRIDIGEGVFVFKSLPLLPQWKNGFCEFTNDGLLAVNISVDGRQH